MLKSRYFKEEEEMNIFFAGWTVRLPGSDDQGHRGGGWQEQPPLQRGWQHAHLQTKVSHLHRETLGNIGQVLIFLLLGDSTSWTENRARGIRTQLTSRYSTLLCYISLFLIV